MVPRTVIVGGGVIGTACAYYLAKAGHAVTVLDRGEIGGSCSHGNCGYVCPSHVLPLAVPGAVWATLKTAFARNSPLKVRIGYALRNLGWFLRFARKCNRTDMLAAAVGIQAMLNNSRQLYDELLQTEGFEVEWDTHGLLFVFQTDHAFHHYEETDKLLRNDFAMPAERWDAKELLEREPALKPGSVSGGYLYRSDAQLRPDRLLVGWRAAVEKLGGQFVPHCEMTGLKSQGETVSAVNTTKGEYPADSVVIATGAWAPLLNRTLGCKLPIVPGKGYSLTLPRPTICPTYPMIFEEHRVAVSPFQTGFRIGSTMEFAGYDSQMNPKRLQILRDGAAVYLKDTGDAVANEEWWGWRPMVYDGKPVIDRSPKFGNVTIAAGHGMLGLSMATGTGKLVSELVTNQKPSVDPRAYSLARFG